MRQRVVLFESDGERHGTHRFWLDGETLVREATFVTPESVHVGGDYRADWGRRGPCVERGGVRIRDRCEPRRPPAAERALNRPGLRVAGARLNPKPLTTALALPGSDPPIWVGEDILVLDATTVRGAEVARDLGGGPA